MKKHKEEKKEVKTDSKEQKIKELTETLQRLQAEFENYKKQVEKQYSNIKKCASESLVIQLLPILDSFELALRNKESNKEEFIKGIELIYSQLDNVLKSQGLSSIEALGKNFDPYKHEVLLKEESEKDNIVLEELQKGYMLNDKVIRHTKVKIAKKKKREVIKDEKK